MDKLGYGIIGVGFFGEKHIEALSTLPNVELVGISRRSLEPLRQTAQQHGIPSVYTNYQELLANPEIEAVSITTHIDNHLKPTLDALKAGKHVFLEKPMAKNVKECEQIVKAAHSSNKLLMVGHICRFDPRVSLAKEAIQEGRVGKIVSLHATRNLPKNIGAEVLDKISPLMGDGIHDTDLMLWFTKSRVKTVYAQNVRIRKFKYPDLGWAMYRFESGAVGVIETIWFLPENTPFTIDARMEIIGTKGAIYIDCGNSGLTINDSTGLYKPDTAYWPKHLGRQVGILSSELSYFISCIRQGKEITIITPEESKTAVAVMEAVEKSAASGKIVHPDNSPQLDCSMQKRES